MTTLPGSKLFRALLFIIKMGFINHEVLPVFQVNIFMMSASSEEELLKLWDSIMFEGKYELPSNVISHFENSAQYTAMYESGGAIDIIYVVNETASNVEDKYIVAIHESYHILNYIFRIIGHKPNIENDEMEAYYLECIYKIIFNFLKNTEWNLVSN